MNQSDINRRARLLERARKVLVRRHYAYKTERSYLGWMRRFYDRCLTLPESWTAERKLETFLTELAEAGCSPTTQNQALNAIVFLFKRVLERNIGRIDAMRARRREHVPFCPSVEETKQILNEVADVACYPTRLITHLLYGCGLRVSEAVGIRIRDVRFDDSQIVIRDPKFSHDRIVRLPCNLYVPISHQMEAAKAVWRNDVNSAVPVALPDRLHQKYKYARSSWQWFWLFPGKRPCAHPRTKAMVRYHCLEGNVQRAVRAAAQACGLDGITPHTLRHAYVTHALKSGANVRDVQAAVGHRHLDTTMLYAVPDAMQVNSPLETVI